MNKYGCSVFGLVVTVALMSPLAYAQMSQSSVLSGITLSQATSNYYFARPNELTIIVNVIGFVQRPGRYEISNSIDLINLIALAGGGTPDASLSDVKITRLVDVDGRIRMKETKVNLDEMAKLTPPDLVLRQGDIIQVDRTGWAGFRDSFNIVVSVAIITSAVVEAIVVSKR